MSRRLISVLLFNLALCVASCSTREEKGLAGTWIMNLDGRPFMVLTLDASGDGFKGTLAHPEKMTTDGLSVSRIGGEILSERVAGGAPDGGVLRIVAENPKNPADKSEYEIRLTAADEVRMKPVGAPLEPWPLRRHRGGDAPRVNTLWDANRSYRIEEPDVAPNGEMQAIYRDDQAARQSFQAFAADAERIGREDAARRARTRALLDSGQLRAAEDFRLAAFVFQHGSEPQDYQLAHTLALVALAKGDRSAAWIAAASFDRYLHAIGKAQIFGTKFSNGTLNQDPFDAALVPDAIRRELGVPAIVEQREQMQILLKTTPPVEGSQ